VKEFAGELDALRADRQGSSTLRFYFPLRGATAVVSIRLYFDRASNGVWIFVAALPPPPA
ncbi:MAG: hypothetical protein ACK4N5_09820, partial [Myxococcales bacterium]